jgi:hypothetical protein
LVGASGVSLGAGNKVLTGIHCANATCSGIIELTKTVTIRAEIGHSGKYTLRTVVELLGRISYSLSEGGQRQFSVQLNAEGVKLLHSATGHHLSCVLTVTSAGGVKRENVSV